MLRDRQIREAFLPTITEGLIIPEKSIHEKSHITDISVFRDDLFYAYEIKSDYDDLRRLPNQVIEYSKHYDFCSIITTAKHVLEVSKLVPLHWQIILACEFGESISFLSLRNAFLSDDISVESLCDFLPTINLRKILSIQNTRKRTKSRKVMSQMIARRKDLTSFRSSVYSYLKN